MYLCSIEYKLRCLTHIRELFDVVIELTRQYNHILDFWSSAIIILRRQFTSEHTWGAMCGAWLPILDDVFFFPVFRMHRLHALPPIQFAEVVTHAISEEKDKIVRGEIDIDRCAYPMTAS
uniref:Uncharacterized protein n=1 Tax=Pristionchus pacificus TaxID=54126 RepID=A0A2A6C851_PRIPA|eukprot:PDM74385.1 hypothetical protein PRIPAC_41741 [Pristionchus pacificus]